MITDDIDTIVPLFRVPTIGPFGSPWTFKVPVGCTTLQGSAHAIPLVASRPSKPPRAPVSGDAIVVDGDMLDPAVITLFRNLREIVNAKPKPEMNEALAEQRRCSRLLRAIDAFIKETWREPVTDAKAVRHYLFEVASRFDMLNDGTGHWMFVPLAKRGGRLDPVEVWEGRQWACAAIECHIRSDKYKRKRTAAAELVAQRPELKRLMRGVSEENLRKTSKEQLASSLLSWHRQFQQGRANMVVQDQWRDLMRLLEVGGTPKEWTAKADFFLGLAINAANKVILPKKAR